MLEPAIAVRNLSKCYQLGAISRHTLVDEVRYWWHKARGRDPREHFGKIGHSATEARKVEAEKDGAQEFWALKDVSFDVQPGEVVGLIGRNGAGKSTLLKILSRITEPTEGEALINGRVGSLLEVGTGFHPELTGRENIYMNGTILGMKKAEIDAKYDRIVEFSELAKFIDTPVKRYSSGMYVRLAFAVAAHLEPEILVIDEVLAVGDAQFQRRCLGKMEEVSQAGRTVLFVSHNMPAILRLCSKAVLLDAGRLVKMGTAEDVVSHYLTTMAEAQESRVWSADAAPGTSQLRLVGVSVTKSDGTPAAVFNVTEEVSVRLRYCVAEANLGFRCLVAFCTQGTVAFAGVEPQETVRERPGVYSSVVTIPANLLSENEYSLNVSLFASRGVKMHFVKAKDVLSFQVADPLTGGSARGDYVEGYAGVVRPLLTWQTDTKPSE